MLKKLMFNLLISLFIITTAQYAQAESMRGKTLYTQVNMFSLKGKSVTWVNYHVDTLVPVNTKVEINKITRSSVTFTLKNTGQKLKLKNKRRHSGLDGKAWAAKHFGEYPVDLNKFTLLERDGIEQANVEIGMSKDAVIVARGFPPAHKTPSLESRTWIYWYNRWNRKAIHFDSNGKVTSIKD